MKYPNPKIGQIFSRYTIIEDLGVITMGKKNKQAYMCKCVCGEIRRKSKNDLLRSPIQSCGCLKSEMAKERATTHGSTRGKVGYMYCLWGNIKDRCYSSKSQKYSIYGGRGIALWEDWRNDFVKFRDWILTNLGERPDNHTMDRINVNGNYEPGNLRWANHHTQANNTRTNVRINQKSVEGIFIATHQSIALAHVAIGKPGCKGIGTCLRGGSKTAYGFIWERAEKLCP